MSEPLFNSLDPFPLISLSYSEAQVHSETADRWLGLEIERVEADLFLKRQNSGARDQQKWIGLPTSALLTPYTELRSMLSLLDPPSRSRVIDLGAGYGRMGFVLARHYPEVDFLGYEIVKERVIEAKRCLEMHHCRRALMKNEDLSAQDFSLAVSEFYFIYDYGSRAAIAKTLEDLRAIAQSRAITVIGRGRLSRDMIEKENPWLSQVQTPEHHGNFSIYRS